MAEEYFVDIGRGAGLAEEVFVVLPEVHEDFYREYLQLFFVGCAREGTDGREDGRVVQVDELFK